MRIVVGRHSYEDLQPSENPRDPADALSGSAPVGSRKITDVTSAITIIRDERGEPVFGTEVRIQATNRPRTVRTRTGYELSWNRLEFKADKNDHEEIGPGSFLMITEHPRSNFWWQQARFRPVSKKSHAERENDDPKTWATDDRDQILEKLEALSYDPWETNGRYLTAGISRPAPGLSLYRTRRDRLSISQLYGASRFEPRNLSDELYASEKVRRLLAMTENRTIKFWPRDASENARKLVDETIAEAASLLHSAVQQALAGPHKDCEEWLEHPVSKLVDRIYRNHLYNTNRRYLRRAART